MNPIEQKERIISMDILRGFSLLGIFVVNMISFHSPFLYYDPFEWWRYEEKTAYEWIHTLAESSFYPCFALLFGYGLAMIRDRAEAKGVNFYVLAARRLGALLIIGCLHAFFVWSGDILIPYAIVGLLTVSMMKASGNTLLLSGAALFLIPNLLFGLYLLLSALMHPDQSSIYADITSIHSSIQAYGSGSWMSIMKQRFHDWLAVNGSSNIAFVLIGILPFMMMGAGAAKLKWIEKAKEEKKKWLIVLIASVTAGLILKTLPMLVTVNLAYLYISEKIGGPLLSFFYIAAILLITTQKWGMFCLKPLAAAGRMSLTIYLLESIIGTGIFYHFGLGLYGQVTLVDGTYLAFAIYFVLVILAECWFMKFDYGPAEKVWRIITYRNRHSYKKRDLPLSHWK